MKRIRITAVADIPISTGREFVVDGRIVAVFHSEQGFYALDGICPHAGGPLAKGKVCGDVVTCPWHGWQFDITTGKHCLNSQLQHTQFSVRAEGLDLWIELPDPAG